MFGANLVNTNHMEICFQYPYQWSNTNDEIKHWLFVLPVDERTTKAFFLIYAKSRKIPFLRVRIPRFVMTAVLKIASRQFIGPTLAQDGVAVKAEQQGYESHWKAPRIEFNPVVWAVQAVMVRKWREYLARGKERGDAGV